MMCDVIFGGISNFRFCEFSLAGYLRENTLDMIEVSDSSLRVLLRNYIAKMRGWYVLGSFNELTFPTSK